MPGFTLKHYSCSALLILTFFLAASKTSVAQELEPSKPENSTAVNIILDDLVAAIDRDDKLGVMQVLSNGFPADAMDANGSTMLMQAAKGGKVKVATLLLDSGADPNLIAMNGATALMFAVNGGHLSTVRTLLAKNADPNLRGPGIPPVLTFAVANGNSEIMGALIRAGAKLDARDQKGYTALEFAFLNKNTAALKFLRPIYRSRASRVDLSPAGFAKAIAGKNEIAVIRTLALGINPNRRINGKMPLEIAKQAGFEKGIALLIHAGANDKKDISAT